MATLKLADEPEQIDVVPEITEAVGADAVGVKVPELVNVCTWYVVPPEEYDVIVPPEAIGEDAAYRTTTIPEPPEPAVPLKLPPPPPPVFGLPLLPVFD
jgi:hypothetical protein